MHALRAHARGGPEVLVYEQAPTPALADSDILVEVHAAAITFDELTWAETWTRAGVDRTPVIPSHEFSGRVAEIGRAVTEFAIGDEVYGIVPFDRDGAAAEYVAVPADHSGAKPISLSHIEAAALPLPALTAQQALFDHAHLSIGERVLVHGGAGGVGDYVVQMAAAAGAHVTATTRGGVEYVKALGASDVIDIRNDDFSTRAATFDVVLDTVSGDTLDRSYGLLRPGGRLITLQTPPDQQRAARLGITAIFFIVTTDTPALTNLAALVDSNALRVTIAATFPLSQGAVAYASGARAGRRPGKTVLVVQQQGGISDGR
ncbi:NADP-dependent oxidoreductase [Mycobacterium xenopi]|uniref:NADP-dependent oxidoreductase n=1 Tax=Mycobacterium xenopi TaxID=1789 RepID=UPI0022EB8871|nr:NADP-dependent oxidoreductase [Mycobacterium xenopi]MDA3659895.1 NADP-dependent oxidoreductase [Mycobacterium xenopi]